MIAKARDLYSRRCCRFLDRQSRQNFYVLSIDLQAHIDFSLTTALNLSGQACMQAPHFMQMALSITCGFFASPWMASAGQLFMHSPHPLHLSWSMEKIIRSLQTRDG